MCITDALVCDHVLVRVRQSSTDENAGEINILMTQAADSSIYRLFHRCSLTHSHRHFSREWLGAADNYLCLRGHRGPSSDALVTLFQRVWREGRLNLAVRVAWSLLWMPEDARR
jgi:hypothetical protein